MFVAYHDTIKKWGRVGGQNFVMHKSRKLLVGLASLTLIDIAIEEASGAPVNAPLSAPAAVYNWSGFYAGGHAGYRWTGSSFSGPEFTDFFTSPPRNESYRLSHGIVGVQAGYNVMIAPSVLAGLEGDWSWGSSRATSTGSSVDDLGDGFIFRSEAELTWQATFRGRLGVVSGPWLFYGTGGVAFVRARWRDNTTQFLVGDPLTVSSSEFTKTLTGSVVGAGVEYMWQPNWIMRVEYLHESFGNVSVPFGMGQIGTLDLKNVNKMRVAISYKFGP
jgi:opacity protein-like surface antigen